MMFGSGAGCMKMDSLGVNPGRGGVLHQINLMLPFC